MPLEKTKEQLFSEIKKNKSSIILQKQNNISYTDAVIHQTISSKEKKDFFQKLKEKDTDSEESEDENSLNVTVVCATTNFITSTMDFFAEDSFNESVKKRGKDIPHILDHNHSAISHVGDVKKVYIEKVPLKALGLNKKGEVNAVLMDSTIRKDYNPEVFKFYSNGKINQHSIGVRLKDVKLAINSKEKSYEEEKAVWDEFYPQVINKELADKEGYFWVTKLADIRENSCVLFGANSLTPTLSTSLSENLEKEELNLFNSDVLEESLQNDQLNLNKEEKPMSNVTLENYVALESELKTLKESQGLEVAKAVQQERLKNTKILQAARTFNISSDMVEKAISKNYSLDMVTDLFTALAEQQDSKTSVTTTGNLSSADSLKKQELEQSLSTKEKNLGELFVEGLEHASKESNYFEGVI